MSVDFGFRLGEVTVVSRAVVGDGHTSAAVVTVMLICASEPLPSILSGLLFCLGVAFGGV